MTPPELSWAAIKRLVHERAKFCCEYCQTSQATTGQIMHIEHIIPTGGDHPDNLCLSCPNCNLIKGTAINAIDPITKNRLPLFNPRQQIWNEHFEWDSAQTELIGKTPIGRATIERLKVNIDRVVSAREGWVISKRHPPKLNNT